MDTVRVISDPPAGWPTQIIIRGKPWSVVYVEDLHAPDGDRARGVTYFAERRIELCAEQSEGDMAETLLHEIRHVYFHHTLFPVDLDKDPRLEEALCDYFAAAVRDLVTRNDLVWARYHRVRG